MRPTEPDVEVLQERADRRVVRVGATVHHPVQPWTPAVHALLNHLHDVGFRYAPRVLGVRDETEILSYIPGRSGADGWSEALQPDGVKAMARLLREYHDAVADWNPSHEPTWGTPRTARISVARGQIPRAVARRSIVPRMPATRAVDLRQRPR